VSFIVQITPLIRPDPGFVDEADIITVAQFSDLDVGHPVSGYKTAKVTLSMHDPAVAGLEPWAFALRVLYEDRLEPVFWGQSNITDDYENGLCTLDAQDASVRMMHHYLRRGDTALNGPGGDFDKGHINPDINGVVLVVEAAQNIASQDARNDPSLGLEVVHPGASTPVGAFVEVERGQECHEVISDITGADGSPDLDYQTPDGLNNYTQIVAYDEIGADRTSATPDTPGAGEVVLSYGLADDNMLGPVVRPGHPTTHAHVLSEDAKYRETSAATAASHDTGGWVDWVRTGFTVADGDTAVLKELANARVRAYGVPPKFTDVVLRPDVAIAHNYGRPSFTPPGGTRVPTFYLGDYITVRAARGYRDFTQNMQITEVHLTWPGWQGPALTVLKLIPAVGGIPVDEET
jgi:hypothetical protein